MQDRLVLDEELILVHALPQLGDQRQAAVRLLIAAGRVHGDADTVGLGDVHRDVGLLQQRVGGRSVLRETGDPEAGPHAQGPVIDHARLLDLVQQLLGGQQRAIEVGERQEDGKLVAAQPCHRVGLPQRRTEPRGDELQHAVAGMMSERVVDLLEAVQVEQQQRQRLALAGGDARRLVETIVQERAVGQVGQRVVIRQVDEALFDPAALTPHARVAQLALDGGDQALQAAFHQVVVRAGPHRGDGGVFADGPRHEDERQVGVVLAQQGERRGAGEARHGVVGDRDIPRLALQRLDQRLRRVDAIEVDGRSRLA